MTNATPSRLGFVNGTGADDAMFLKLFSGEVLTAFQTVQVMDESRHLVRTITSGKSAQFPATWRVNARYHTPGQFIAGQQTKQAERVISIDDLLIADVFIPNIDEAKNHYDVRSIFTSECGYALAQEMDKNVLRTALLAARAASTINEADAPGGSTIEAGADIVTNAGGALVSAFFDAAQILDEKDIPEFGRFCVLKPAQYYKLVLDDKAINRDFTSGNGDIRTGKVFDIAGIEIVKSNNLPQAVVASPAGDSPSGEGGNTTFGTSYGPRPLAKYAGDFSDTIGLVMHPYAVGTVKLLDLAMEGEYQINRQGTLMVAKYAMGHGILRPECAVELSKATA